jgi:malate permease and related proteins
MTGLAGIYLAVGTMLLPVVACAAVGVEWGRRKIAYPVGFVSTLVTCVSVPGLVFHTLMTTRLSQDTIFTVALAAALGIAVMGALSAVLLRLWGLPVRALVPTSTFPNAGNLGLPLSQLAFGDAGLSVAVTFFAVCSFLQHTVGVRILASSKGQTGSWVNPVMLAAVLSVVLRAFRVDAPPWMLESSRLLGTLTVPLMLISLGYTLVTITRSGIRTGAGVGMIRLAVGILGGTLVVKLLHLPPNIAGVTLFQMMMPVAVVNYMYAQRFTDHAEIAAGAVLGSTACFLALCPLAFWYVGALGTLGH